MTPDQHAGAEWLAARRVALLADVPGLGKTAQVVSGADRIGARYITAIMPAVLRPNAAREWAKWSLWGHDVHIVAKGSDPIPDTPGVIATSFALAASAGVRKQLMKRPCDLLWIDEAHNLKTPGAKRTKAILGDKGLVANAPRVWLTTGTPMPNTAAELYVFARLAGLWDGNYADWVGAFCHVRESMWGSQVVGTKDHARLAELLAPAMLRRTKVEGRPALTIDTLPLEIDQTTPSPFNGLDDAVKAELELAVASGSWDMPDVPALSTLRRMIGLAKIGNTAQLIQTELDGGLDRVLCFAHHREFIRVLAEKLAADKGLAVDTLTGDTPAQRRQIMIDAFQSDGGRRVLVAQINAAGEGLTLTRCKRVMIAEPSWVPKDNTQAIARCWRRGQTEPVRASFISLAGSLDEQIAGILARKANDIVQVVGADAGG